MVTNSDTDTEKNFTAQANLEYGELFSGKFGTLARGSANIYVRRTGSIQYQRERVASALRDRGKKIVVVLDDIDRLSASEIREIFKLVRLTASFPMLIYIVCCDRLRVEQALNDKEIEGSGRNYLEKIIQFPFKLPEVPGSLLETQLRQAINNVLADVNVDRPMDEDEWPNIFKEIIQPLVRNMRDVRRYTITIRHTLGELDGLVARKDILALEAIRIFLPDMFMRLPGAINVLTVPAWFFLEQSKKFESDSPHETINKVSKWLESQATQIIEAAGQDGKIVAQTTIDRIFPNRANIQDLNPGHDSKVENTRAKNCRVSEEHIFRLYLERVTSPDLLGSPHVVHMLSLLQSPDRLRQFLHTLPTRNWYRLLHAMVHESVFRIPLRHIETTVVVLLDHCSKLPDQLTDWILLDATKSTLKQIIGLSLQELRSSGDASHTVPRILEGIKSLSSRLLLIELVRDLNNSDPDFDIVFGSVLQEHEDILRNEIYNASVDSLAGECDLARILCFAKGDSDRSNYTDISVDELTITVLLSALRQKDRSDFNDDLPTREDLDLDYDVLVELYGNRDFLKKMIDDLNSAASNLVPSIEDRIPFNDFKYILEYAANQLNNVQPEKSEQST